MRSKMVRSELGSVARKNSPPVWAAIRFSRPSSMATGMFTGRLTAWPGAGARAWVGSGRRLCEALASEDHQTYPVVGAPPDEFCHHFLCHPQSVLRLEVLGGHGTGDVEGHHDVDAAGGGVLFRRAQLGPGLGHRRENAAQRSRQQRKMPEMHSPGALA